MKKTVYLVVIAVITIGAILFGSNMHFKKMNKKWGSFKDGITSLFEDEDGNINFSFNFNEEETTTETDDEVTEDSVHVHKSFNGSIDKPLAVFTNIEIDAKVSGITIEEGKEFYFEADYNRENLEPKVEVNNGTLCIKQNGIKNNSGNNRCNMKITVPRFTDLDKLDISVNVGEINISNLKCNKANVKTNVGEVDIIKVDFDDLEVENNVGEIKIRTTGDIDEYSLDLETNIGEVNVDGHSQRHSYRKNAGTGKEIRAKSNVGEISIR